MSRFALRHRLGMVRQALPATGGLLITAVLAMIVTGPNHAGGKKDPPPPPQQISDSTDLDGEDGVGGGFEAIIAHPAGDHPNLPDPGQVIIQSDDGSVATLQGHQDDDWFGFSVAVAGDINSDPNEDFNGDGYADLIIGAPREAPRGYAYVFYGPFDPNEVLEPEDADMTFFPPEAATYDFGMSVRQVADIDCDGTPDIGIGGVQPAPPGGGGGVIVVTYFVSGATGQALYVADDTTPFNPWLEIVGDAEGDGDVDNVDIAIIERNMGRISSRLTLRDGDFNGDGRITQADKNMAMANFGADHFAAVRGCTNPCPNPPPQGYHCIYDCEGDPVLVPINVWEYCDPIMCTQECWCGYQVFPMPPNYPDLPHWIPHNEVCMIMFGPSEDANWEVTEGAENIIILPESNGKILVILTIAYGPVTVTAEYYCCATGGDCWLTVPMLVTCNGIPDPYGDTDLDGIANAPECEAGLNPDFSDTDGDSMPDGWEIAHGFDPLNPADGMQNADGDNVPNYLEYLYGSDPFNPNSGAPAGQDPDGDGVITWFEEIMGTDPNNGSSYMYPDFTPGDMSWAVVNNVIQYLNSEIMYLCEGDCFRLHATGAATSWEVLQGGQYLELVDPDSLSSCISGKWCLTGQDITEPVDIIIASYTPNPHGGGMPVFGFVHIIALPDSHPDCGGECEIEVVKPNGDPAPDLVCVEEPLTLKAEGAENETGPYVWTLLPGVPGSVEFANGNTGQQVTLNIIEPGEFELSVERGECAGGKTVHVGIDLDIDSDNSGNYDSPDFSAQEDELEDGIGIKTIIVNRNDDDGDYIPDYADGSVSGERFVPLVLNMSGVQNLREATLTFEYDASDPSEVSQTEVVLADIQSSYIRYTRGPGSLRIWRVDGHVARSAADFVDSGEELDPDDFAGETTFYVEAVKGSPTALAITCTLTLPDGTACSDAVKVLPFDSITGLSENEISGFNIVRDSATVNGTPGRDLIIGTVSNDTIAGNAGDDIIVAGVGDDMIDPGPGNDVIFASKGHNYIGPFGGGPAFAPEEGQDEILDEEDAPFTTEQVLLVYRLMYGEDDPWLTIFLSPEVGGRVEAVEGDGWPFSQVDWDNRSHGDGNGGWVREYVIQLEFDLGSPVVAATLMRQELLDIAGDSLYGASDKFQQALIDNAWLKALMQDDFDEELETFQQLREASVQNAASVAATMASLYSSSVGIISEGADIIITIGELVDGEIGLAGGALCTLPFVSRPMVDAGAKAIARTDAGQAIFKRGENVPGLDKRAIQGIDSGQHGLGLIPRKDFAISHVFEGKTVDGKTRLLVGTPQLTSGPDGPQHAATVEMLARARYDGPDAEYTVMNRSFKTATGRTDLGNVSGWRPDVSVMNRNGKVDLIEVQSASETTQEMMDKLMEMRNALPANNQGTVFVHALDGTLLAQFPQP